MATKKNAPDETEVLLRKQLKKLEEERDEILATYVPLEKKRVALQAKIQPLEAELRAVNQEIRAMQAPGRERLVELGRSIGLIATSLGGRRITNTGEERG